MPSNEANIDNRVYMGFDSIMKHKIAIIVLLLLLATTSYAQKRSRFPLELSDRKTVHKIHTSHFANPILWDWDWKERSAGVKAPAYTLDCDAILFIGDPDLGFLDGKWNEYAKEGYLDGAANRLWTEYLTARDGFDSKAQKLDKKMKSLIGRPFLVPVLCRAAKSSN